MEQKQFPVVAGTMEVVTIVERIDYIRNMIQQDMMNSKLDEYEKGEIENEVTDCDRHAK